MTFLDDGAVARLRALAATPEEGELLGGRFELCAPIGEGGMGVVWSAWDREGEREVAVKVLRDLDDAARERFAREAAALTQLAHAAVARPIAHGISPSGAPYLAMERLTGRTLAERLRAGCLGMREAAALGHAVAGALVEVHAAGLVHRDVKPSNLFLVGGAAADVRLLDFGLARGREAPRITRTGALLGTPGYMAPEQVRKDAAPGPPADVFALGAVLFECLAGRPAFRAEEPERVLAQILLEAPPLLRAVRPATPIALEALVFAMLEKDPARRPDAASVARALATLEAALGDEAAGAPPAVGTLVGGKYRVEGNLGEGGMGLILAATHVELGRPVALKLLRGRRSDEDEARLLREARALSRLESEHAARVLDVGRQPDGAPYLVIERLEGADLARVLHERGPLPVGEAVRWLLQACEALAEAHALGIVHRDLKPSNLFLARRRDGSECLKVLDFGISKVKPEPDERSLTAPSAVMGSAWYMSPEQLAGASYVDARADVWALGVVLHELLTGAPPFDAETAAAVGARIAAGAPTRLREARRDAPAALEGVILRCLAKAPGSRFATVGVLARALAPFAEGASTSVDRIARVLGEALPAPAPPPSTRRRVPMVALSIALMAAAAVLLWRARANEGLDPPRATGPAVIAAPPATTPAAATPLPQPPPSASEPAPPAAKVVPIVSRPATKAPRQAPTAAPPQRPPATIDVRDPALDGR